VFQQDPEIPWSHFSPARAMRTLVSLLCNYCRLLHKTKRITTVIEENGDWLAVPRFRHHHRQPRGSFLVTNTEEAQLVKKNNSRSIDQVQ
jgi:hypothetical protein